MNCPPNPDCLVLGAGAAGLTAAWKAAEGGASVLLVDRAARAGNKVRIAGGGKANVTNRTVSADWYVGENPDFCRPVLKRYGSRVVLSLLEALRIPLEERECGQLFCRTPADRLVEALLERCRAHGVHLCFNHMIEGLEAEENCFRLRLRDASGADATLTAPVALIALGSPAWPQIGASNLGHTLAVQWGHRIVPVRPVLAPFILPEDWPLHGLSGISLPVRITAGSRSFTRDLLFTHKGLSGPAALLASCFWSRGMALDVDFLPAVRLLDLLHAPEHGRLQVRTLLSRFLPERLADALCPRELARRKVAELAKKDRERLARSVHAHQANPSRLEGLSRAEAAAGGIDTREVDPLSLESRLRPGLFFAGEVLDVTGLLGGYNLHWAWASGLAAGKALARRARGDAALRPGAG